MHEESKFEAQDYNMSEGQPTFNSPRIAIDDFTLPRSEQEGELIVPMA